MHPRLKYWLVFLSCSMCLSLIRAGEDEPKGGPREFRKLKFRQIGPAAGGRVARACGVPGDPKTFYAATAGGGVWKSSDGGIHWKPIFDDQPIASIGSIAVAPSDPNVIYVGSGEANIRGNVMPGNGIYKSTDAGKTWKHVWQQEGQIGTMLVHPSNPDIAYAAVLGHAFGPNDERGVYRTVDGGKTWVRVLFKDRDTGTSDVCFDPNNPRILFAGLWQTRRQPWEYTSGGPGSGLYQSRDGGDTWTQLVPPPPPESPEADRDEPPGKKYCDGLPEGIWGKIGLAVAPSDSRRVYALIEAEKGGLFRSEDGGANWKLINAHRALRQRAWYFSTITVHPKNPDVVYCPQVPLLKSIDGGKSFQRVKGTHHGDHHDLWIDPKNPDRMIDSNDGGVDVTINGGETWFAPPLPIAQFYHISVDNRTPYHVAGNMQDIGTASGPSNSLSSGGIRVSDWYPVGGGETGFAVPDPSNPHIVYAGEYGGYISRYDHRTGQAHSIGAYQFNPSGHAVADLKYRFQWTAPILVSRHDPKVVYHGANVLFRTDDQGKTWSIVSPDLTRNDKSKQKWSGGPITGDNTGVEYYGTIFSLAESPKQPGLLWAGSDDGLVHVSRDNAKTWRNVTPHIKGLPEWAAVCCIEPSPFEAETAYVAVDAHRLDDMRPYLFKTTDAGKTWKSLGDGLPRDHYIRVVREDPHKKDLLYAGTERGLFFSRDGGVTWAPFKLNLPTVAVSDLAVKNDDLVVGTNGRSIWIFDDLAPLREYTPKILAGDFHLFGCRPAVRYRERGTVEEHPRLGSFDNPPPGVVVHYYLQKKPEKEITLEVLDARGLVVQTLTSKEDSEDKTAQDEGGYSDEKPKKTVLATEPGLHRAVWNLHYAGAKLIASAKLDGGHPDLGPMALPGRYTVKLTVAGKSQSQQVEVFPDPRLPNGAVAEVQLALALSCRDDISRLTHVAESIRAVRQQLAQRSGLLKDEARAGPLRKAAEEMQPALDALENELHNPKAQVSYDILAQKGGAKLYSQLAHLFELIKDSDGPPTQGWRDQFAEHSRRLRQLEQQWESLRVGDIAKLNDLAKKLDLPAVIVPSK